MKQWLRSWFAPAPYFDLALMRILLVGLQQFLLLLYGFEFIAYYHELPANYWLPIPTFKLSSPTGWAGPPPIEFVYMVFWATFFIGIAAFVGLWTNITTFLFTIGNIYVQAYQYSFGEYHHPEAVMMIALLAVSLGPCGRVLSVDNWLRARRGGHQASVPILELKGENAGWPIRFMQCFIPLMYMSAALAKFTADGVGWTLDWANGYTLQKYLAVDGMRWNSPLAVWVAQFHVPILIAQWFVLIFQATYFISAFSVRARWFFVPMSLLFHIGIYVLLRAPFPQWIVMSGFYVPWATAFLLLAKQRIPVSSVSHAG